MKCSECRRKEIETMTFMERVKRKLIRMLFAEEYTDMSHEKFTQGFGDGYQAGFKKARELITRDIT